MKPRKSVIYVPEYLQECLQYPEYLQKFQVRIEGPRLKEDNL